MIDESGVNKKRGSPENRERGARVEQQNIDDNNDACGIRSINGIHDGEALVPSALA